MLKFLGFFRKYRAILLIIVCSVLAYGVMIPWLGLYTDDWTFLWAYHNYGSAGLFDYFRVHRPVWGLTYQFAMPLIGARAWVWHLYGLFWRIAASLVFYWLVRLVWPQREKLALYAGMLFAVYPGYLLQPLSLVMGHVILLFTVFLISNVFTLLAIKHPRYRYLFTGLALLGSLFNVLSMEYFIPLEAVRIALILLALPAQEKFFARLWHSLLRWIPYGLLLIGVVVWRAFFYKAQINFYNFVLMDALKENPLGAAVQLLKTVLESIYQAALYAWVQPLIALAKAVYKISKLNITVLSFSLAAFLLLLVILLIQQKKAVIPEKQTLDWSPLGVSLFALFIAGWPFYVTGLPVEPTSFNSRFTLPFMFGAAILLAFFLEKIKKEWISSVFLSGLAASAIGFHFITYNSFRVASDQNTRTMYELSWRVPGLKPGTVLVSNEGSEYFTYSTLTAQLNLLYPIQPEVKTAYGWIFPKELSMLTSDPVTTGQDFEEFLYTYPFEGNTSRLLALQVSPNACLRLINSDSTAVDGSLHKFGVDQISDLSMIDLDAEPAKIEIPAFGREPAHRWCYYFEKTDLALQMGDTDTILKNYELVKAQSLAAMQPVEWFPYIEGLGKAGSVKDALQISQSVLSDRPDDQELAAAVCSIWKRVEQKDPSAEIGSAMSSLGCH